jgi:hypothetical protein
MNRQRESGVCFGLATPAHTAQSQSCKAAQGAAHLEEINLNSSSNKVNAPVNAPLPPVDDAAENRKANSSSFIAAAQALASTHQPRLPETGLVRLSSIIGPGNPIPVGKSTWWEGVKTGRYPKPVKLGPNITAWRVEDIRRLIERGMS